MDQSNLSRFRSISLRCANRHPPHSDGRRQRREGGKADKAKPFKGLDGGTFEIALKHRGDAFRAIYAVRIGDDIWVLHAFQKKSKSGIKTPRMEIDLVRERLKRLNEALDNEQH